jgi:hypothetical protein
MKPIAVWTFFEMRQGAIGAVGAGPASRARLGGGFSIMVDTLGARRCRRNAPETSRFQMASCI